MSGSPSRPPAISADASPGYGSNRPSSYPIDVGIRVTGQSGALDLVEMSGPMRAGIELAPGASATLNGGRFSVTAAALLLGERRTARG